MERRIEKGVEEGKGRRGGKKKGGRIEGRGGCTLCTRA